MEQIRGLFILFVLLGLFMYIVPGEHYKKYIRFFSGVILIVAFLSPLLSLFWDDGDFFDKIEYEAFVEGLEELSRDNARIEFAQNDYYRKKYELAIAEDVRQIAAAAGYETTEVAVHLTEDYTMKGISLTVKKSMESDIFVAPVEIGGDAGTTDHGLIQLRDKLAGYYQMEKEEVTVCGG